MSEREGQSAEWDDLVADCLARLQRDKSSAAACLLAQPHDVADQIGPALRAAERLRGLDLPAMSPQAVMALQQRLQARIRELRAAEKARQPAASRVTQAFTRLASITLVVACFLGAGGGGVYAATNSLPGTPLYPVKRAAERFELRLARDPGSRATLHATFALRRMHEALTIEEHQHRWEVRTLAEMQTELAQATEAVRSTGEDRAKLALETVAALAAHAETRFNTPDDSDETAREARSVFRQARTEALMALGRPDEHGKGDLVLEGGPVATRPPGHAGRAQIESDPTSAAAGAEADTQLHIFSTTSP